MAAPYQYKDLAEFMGSWPYSVIQDPSPLQQIQPSSIQTKATMIGTRRETSDGYLVGGLAMTVYADVAGTPTAHAVTFPSGAGSGLTTDHYTLDEVIARFLASTPALPANSAQRSDNFLMLQCQTVGEDSYLRLESVLGAENVFHVLGLQPGILVRGGSLKAAQHIDPTRQVAGVNQGAMQHGELFDAAVLNRMALQLGVNAGVARGITSLARVAVRTEEEFTGTGSAGIQLNAGSPEEPVFTGAVGSPSYEQLKLTAMVVDMDGNEFMKEMEYVGATDADIDFEYNSDSGEQEVTFNTSTPFLSTDPEGNFYVIVTNLTVETQLNDVPLKIIRYISTSKVAVDPVDPATGLRAEVTEDTRSGRRTQIYNVRCDIEGFYSDAGLTTPIEQVQSAITGGSGSVGRVETSNRVYVPTANFTANCQIGDLVQWTGAAAASPYSNNGNYRISAIVDDKRLELVNEDYSPAFLNPSVGLGLGSIAVVSDGDFFSEPYIKFAVANLTNFQNGRGAIPDGEDFRVIYKVARSLAETLETNPGDLTTDPRAELSSNSAVQKAIARIVGPSIARFEDELYGKEMLNLDFLSREHAPHSGKHSTIHPDVINMFPEISGEKFTLRAATADVNGIPTFVMRDEGGDVLWGLNNEGAMKSTEPGATSTAASMTSNPFTGYIPGYMHDAGAASVYLRGTIGASLGLDSNNAGASGTLAQITAGTGEDTAHVFFSYDDGGVIVANRHTMKLGLQKASNDAFSALVLGTESNDSGSAVPNLLVVGLDGGFLFHAGALTANDGITPNPDVGVTIRARDSGESELLRLQGWNIDDQTLAISYAPRRDLDIFSFMELDLDPGGDWFQNFVLTEEADNESSGADGVAQFRFVTGAAIGGIGDEVLRIGEVGVEFGMDRRTTLEHAILPRMKAKQAADSVGVTQLLEVEPFDLLDEGGARLYTTHNGAVLQWLFNGKRVDDVTPLTPIDKEGASANADVSWTEYHNAVNHSGAYAPTFYLKSIRNAVSFPADPASDAETQIEYRGFNGTGGGAIGPQIYLRDTRIVIADPTAVAGGSNLPITSPPPNLNSFMAKTSMKAWCVFDANAGTFTLLDSYNIDGTTFTIDTSPERLIVRMFVELDDQDKACVVTGMNGRTSPLVSFYNAIHQFHADVNTGGAGDQVHCYYTTQSGGTTTQGNWNTITGKFSFVVYGTKS